MFHGGCRRVSKALKVLNFRGLIREEKDGYIVSPKIFQKDTEYKIR